jgi:hypothetical protein
LSHPASGTGCRRSVTDLGPALGRHLIALAARAVREAGDLWRRALGANKRLATLSIDAEVRFASAADRAAFTADLAKAITGVIARHHQPAAAHGRSHRLVVIAYPSPRRETRKEHACR